MDLELKVVNRTSIVAAISNMNTNKKIEIRKMSIAPNTKIHNSVLYI